VRPTVVNGVGKMGKTGSKKGKRRASKQ
jgi:hypothetical protein